MNSAAPTVLRRSHRIASVHTTLMSESQKKCRSKCACKVKLSDYEIGDIYNRYRLENFLTDLTIVAIGGVTFRAHKILMMVHGSKFSKLFEKDDVIELEASPEVVKELISLPYTGSINVNQENFSELVTFGLKYDMRGIIKSASNYVLRQIDDKNIISAYKTSCQYFCNGVKKYVQRRILQNFLNVNHFSANELLKLPIQELKDLLSNDLLNVTEEQLFRVIAEWSETYEEAKSLICCIRTSQAPFNWLVEVNNHPLFMNDPRLDSTERARIPNEIALSMGGWEQNEGPTYEIESYNIRERKWTKISSMQSRRAYHSVQVFNSQLFVLGGFRKEPEEQSGTYFAEMESFDLQRMVWNEQPPMNLRRCYVMTAAVGGKIYAFGGSEGQGLVRHQSAECYDPTTNAWAYIPDMISQRSDGAAAVGGDGCIYVFGGFTGTEILNTVEIYNPEQNTWSMGPPMSVPRSGCQAVSYEGHIFVMGGFDGNQRLSLVESLDTNSRGGFRQWRTRNDMITQRSNFASTVIDEKIMVSGGFTGQGVTNEVELYSPTEDVWTLTTQMKKKKSALAMVTISDLENPEKYLRKSTRCNYM